MSPVAAFLRTHSRIVPSAYSEWVWVVLRVVVVLVLAGGSTAFLRKNHAYELVLVMSGFVLAYDVLFAVLLRRGRLREVFWGGLVFDQLVLIITWWAVLFSPGDRDNPTDLYLVLFPLSVSLIVRAGPVVGFLVATVLIISVLMSDLVFSGAESYQVRQMPVRVLFLLTAGALIGLLVAQMRQQEQLALGLRRQSRRILQSAGEAILAVDRDGNVTEVNREASQMLRLSAGQVIGKPIEALEASTSVADGWIAPPVRSALGTGDESLALGVELDLGVGRRVFVDRAVSLFHRRSGEVAGAVIVLHDVTERAELSSMKDEFVSMVSHDLRTPLTSITGSLKLAIAGAGGELSPPMRELLGLASNGGERLTRLVSDLLDLQTLDAGRMELRVEACTVEGLFGDVEAAMDGLVRETGVHLAFEREADACSADSDRMVQVLVNLVGNAIKFSPEGGTVTVAAERAGNWVRFSVRDEGPGIPPAECKAIFQPFYQVPEASNQHVGTGLGLAISRRIVDLHRGHIWAESDGIRGTTVVVDIPTRD